MLDTACLGRIEAPAVAAFVHEGANIVVAIRPENLTLSLERPGDDRNAVGGVIKTAAYLGDRSHFYVSVEGRDKPLVVAAQEGQTSLGQSLENDTPVWLAWPEKAVILLEAG